MTIDYTPQGHAEYVCTLTIETGAELTVEGTVKEGTARDSGDEELTGNRSLVMMLSAYAHNEAQARRLRADEKVDSHRKAAKKYRKDVESLAGMIERLDGDAKTRQEWCSGCFSWCVHHPVGGMARPLPTYLCGGCGAPTTKCPAPRCDHFASRGFGSTSTPKYCAEHRHDIPSFEKLETRLARLEGYKE